MFSPDHIAGRFCCSDVAVRTRGVRIVETILLGDSDFVTGFVLDRLAMRRRRFDAEKSKTKL